MNYAVKPVFGKITHATQRVCVPGSKSITARALLIAALARGTSVLCGIQTTGDCADFIGGLRSLDVEVFHRQPPADAPAFDPGNHGGPAGSGGEKLSGAFRVADGGGEADAPRLHARYSRQALYEAEALAAAVLAQQRVDLVDHDVTEVAEELGHHGVAAHEQRLERLRRDLQDAGRPLHEPRLVRGRDVPVPVPDARRGR